MLTSKDIADLVPLTGYSLQGFLNIVRGHRSPVSERAVALERTFGIPVEVWKSRDPERIAAAIREWRERQRAA